MKKIKLTEFIPYFLSLIAIFFVWLIASYRLNVSLILPSPKSVGLSILTLITKLEFWKSVAFTFGRIISSFLITTIFGTLIGFFCGKYTFIRKFCDFPLVILRSTPVIAIILLALFWFKSDRVPVFVSVLMTLPIMITNIRTGFLALEEKYEQLSKIFEFSPFEKFIHITAPQLLPYFFGGMISCFGLSWKVVIAGEVLALPKASIGTSLQLAQIHLESDKVFAITILIITMSFILEKLITVLLNHYLEKKCLLKSKI